MRPIGFSTGALAYADFRKALSILDGTGICVLELSALRYVELDPLLAAIDDLALEQFSYISVHAPSAFPPELESAIVNSLRPIADRGWPIIVHPDTIGNHCLWRALDRSLCIENMDSRKTDGRSAFELKRIFELLPAAQFCFDIGHARQFDSTMTEAYALLTEFKKRLQQVHIS
jgi:hypothetical protein